MSTLSEDMKTSQKWLDGRRQLGVQMPDLRT